MLTTPYSLLLTSLQPTDYEPYSFINLTTAVMCSCMLTTPYYMLTQPGYYYNFTLLTNCSVTLIHVT